MRWRFYRSLLVICAALVMQRFAGTTTEISTAVLGLSLLGGLVHGGYDHAVAARWSRWKGLFGQVMFHVEYVCVAAAVLGLWWLAPTGALLLFLTSAAVHFGESDLAHRGPQPAFVTWSRGAVIVFAPMLAWPAEAEQMLSNLAGVHGVSLLPLEGVAPLVAPGVLVWGHLASLVWQAREQEWDPADLETELLAAGAVAMLCLSAGPLLGIAAYFALWHTPDHFASLRSGQHRMSAILWASIPRGLAMVGPLIALWWLAPDVGAWARWVVVLTSALTLPHALLTHLAQRRPHDSSTHVAPLSLVPPQ